MKNEYLRDTTAFGKDKVCLFDYYAARIMQGIITREGICHHELKDKINQVYDIVEKMLVIRKERIDNYRENSSTNSSNDTKEKFKSS